MSTRDVQAAELRWRIVQARRRTERNRQVAASSKSAHERLNLAIEDAVLERACYREEIRLMALERAAPVVTVAAWTPGSGHDARTGSSTTGAPDAGAG